MEESDNERNAMSGLRIVPIVEHNANDSLWIES